VISGERITSYMRARDTLIALILATLIAGAPRDA
jgi:hypothetical protein